MSGRLIAFILAAAFWVPAPAAADWLVSPYVGVRFAGSTTFFLGRQGAEENKFTFGSSVGLLTDGVLGVEADVAFVPGFFHGEAAAVSSSLVTTIMGNVIVAAPLDVTQYGLRPYATGGFGLLRAVGDTEALDDAIHSNLFGMNVGGGAIGPISPRTSVRFDLRYFRNLSGDPEAQTANTQEVALSFWRGTVGLTVRF